MKLDEILNSDINYEVVLKTPEKFRAKAKIENQEILFSAIYLDIATPSVWEISFEDIDKSGNRTVKLTNKGNELKVFSFVLKCLGDFVKQYDPEILEFLSSKSDESRSKLYRRLILKNSQKLGFKLKENPDFDSAEADLFQLEKI